MARAAAAINAGLCTTVLILYADTGVAEPNAHDRSYRREWTEPYGLMGLLVAESLPVVPLFPRLLAMTQDADSVRSNVFLGFFILAPSVGALMVMLSLRLSVVPCRSGVP